MASPAPIELAELDATKGEAVKRGLIVGTALGYLLCSLTFALVWWRVLDVSQLGAALAIGCAVGGIFASAALLVEQIRRWVQ